uniref:Cholesteryl ester transfer protein n=1 Tax=Calidris pygmaea TaxID=425635 RepID=A0A8C3JPI6_9CHAR
MGLGTFGILLVLIHASAACEFGPFPYSTTGIACRMTKPAALLLNQETARVIQAAFRNAKFPNITGERSMRLLGKVAYGLSNIQVNDLSIEQSEVELKENDAIHITIKNVTAVFKGTLTYGYAGAWFLQLFHSVDFEIESSIDLQINIKLMCQKDQVAADASDCYLSFHKLTLRLQGDKEPGWLKQLFTDFISFTLKLVLKSEVCNEINFLAQVLANFVHDLAANFVQDEDIRLDISLASDPLIKANYLESHHKVQYSLGHLLLNDVFKTLLYKFSGFQNDPSIRNFLQTMISVVGIPEVISRIEPALTSLMNSKGLHLFEIRNPEIITRKGYVIVQLDFSFPNHLLLDFLEKRL